MALYSCYSSLVRQDLLNEKGLHRLYKEIGLRKLLQNFEREPTVGSKVTAFFSCYSGLARQDLPFKELGFHM
jgi:hypothetical protein